MGADPNTPNKGSRYPISLPPPAVSHCQNSGGPKEALKGLLLIFFPVLSLGASPTPFPKLRLYLLTSRHSYFTLVRI